jgi:spore coat assembly protein
VTRKKYHHDIIFRVIGINNNIALLKGEMMRLMASSPLDDLEIYQNDHKKKITLPFIKDNPHVIKGKILHIDGDQYFLKKALEVYQEYHLEVSGYYYQEEEIPRIIKDLINLHHPNILVITGHDSFNFNLDKTNIAAYKNSLYYIEACEIARKIYQDKDDLIIIAGACQSNFEALIRAGANFASSPKRGNIHLLDPVIIATFMANYRINEKIDIEYLLGNTISKNMGGIETKGSAREVFLGGS